MRPDITDSAYRIHVSSSPWLADSCTCRTNPTGSRRYICRTNMTSDEHFCLNEARACGGYCDDCFEYFMQKSAIGSIDKAHLERQIAWSEKTFGPGLRTKGVIDHIRKELVEIEDDPTDLNEWVDVIILAFDGAWRSGADPMEIITAIKLKQERNENRQWPDWRTMSENEAIEHIRAPEEHR